MMSSRSILAFLVVGFLACGGVPSATPGDGGTPPAEADGGAPPPVPPHDDGGDATPDAAGPLDAGVDAPGDAGQGPPAACTSCASCAGHAGDFHAQPFPSGGTTRHYYLHVPPSYACGSPAPLLVDFHGTAEGVEADNPEEYYALSAMDAVADQLGFIVVRPRSLFASSGTSGSNVYQWDVNPGDLARNITFTDELVPYLESQYRIDPARVYAAGFSNGTNMAIQFLGDPGNLFHGYALVEGGLFTYDGAPAHAPFGANPPRIYATTGYRDYIYDTTVALLQYLNKESYPPASLWVRQTDSGHELYGWDYTELFEWLDQGKMTGPSGTLAAGWARDPSFTSTDGITKLVAAPSGVTLATGTGGDFYSRSPAGAWTKTTHLDSAIPIYTDMCLEPSGTGWAVGQQGLVATTSDSGASWQSVASVPEFDTIGFGYSYLTSVACNANLVVGGGFWADAYSTNGGASWHGGSMLNQGYAAQAATVAVSAAGTWIGGGYYDYIGRSTDGQTFSFVSPASSGSVQWFTGIASQPGGLWWIAGEEGTLYGSSDDGQTWNQETSPVADDFYGIAFANATTGLAVGRAGLAVLTVDGGVTWKNVSTGLNVFLAGVTWLDATTALVGGENGTMLTYTVSGP